MYPVRPNPFRRSAHGNLILRFALAKPAAIELRVYNLLGQEVWAYRSPGTLPAGEHAMTWDATAGNRRRVANGVYLVTLRSGPVRLQQKVLILH